MQILCSYNIIACSWSENLFQTICAIFSLSLKKQIMPFCAHALLNEINDRDMPLSVQEKYLTQSITFFSPANLDNTRKYVPKQRDNSIKTMVRIYLDFFFF